MAAYSALLRSACPVLAAGSRDLIASNSGCRVSDPFKVIQDYVTFNSGIFFLYFFLCD